MELQADYKIIEQISISKRSIISRAIDPEGQTCILKQPVEEIPEHRNQLNLQYEYDLLTRFESDLIIKVYRFHSYGPAPAIEMEDFQGKPLDQCEILTSNFVLRDHLPERFNIAIKIVRAVAEIHASQIIHRDLHPGNILFRPETGQMRIIDFGSATEVTTEHVNPVFNPGEIRGNLIYISPEQTGRMNRDVDYRSDYYSIGVILYQLFTGILPFGTDNSIELLYSHLAKMPVPPHFRNTSLPEELSEVIMKLLEKSPENRYQSTRGIINDLVKISESLRTRDVIHGFKAGEKDISEVFQIPGKLYGRDDYKGDILKIWELVTEGETGVVFISGYSGIGKSSLVRELYGPLTEKHGFFVQGKFEHLTNDVPFAPIVQALRDLIHKTFTYNPETLEYWKIRIKNNLGGYEEVLIDTIPELNLFLPELKTTDLDSLEETGQYYREALVQLISVFASPDHPLIMFLDDLHRADLSSLDVIRDLTGDKSVKYLMFLGAYRSNEVDIGHPIKNIESYFESSGSMFLNVELKELDTGSVRDLLVDLLHKNETDVELLAHLCHDKTGGNPFYLHRFLHHLHDNGLIIFDIAEGVWTWDLDSISHKEVTENVIDLLIPEMMDLSPLCLKIVQAAAFLGDTFSLLIAAEVLEISPEKASTIIPEAVRKSFIIPVGKSSQMDQYAGYFYQFIHDRIRQAAYSTISEEEADQLHLKIGRFQLKNATLKSGPGDIFSVVGHLNHSLSLLTREETQSLSVLNMKAAQISRNSGAYESAREYMETALALSPAIESEREDLIIAMHLEAAELSILNHDYKETEKHVQYVLENSDDLMLRVRSVKALINKYYGTHELRKAIDTALEILDELGFHIPRNPGDGLVLTGLMKAIFTLSRKNKFELSNLPEMTDVRSIAIMRLASEILSILFATSKNLFAVVIFKMFNLTLKMGIESTSAFVYVAMGMFLSGIGRIEQGYLLSQIGLGLSKRLKEPMNEARHIVVYYATTSVWKDNIRDSIRGLERGYQLARASGNAEFTDTAFGAMVIYQYFAGHNLSELRKYLAGILGGGRGDVQKTALVHVYMLMQATANLVEYPDDVLHIKGSYYNEDKEFEESVRAGDNTLIAGFYLQKMILSVYYEIYDKGVAYSETARKYLDGIMGLYHTVLFYYYETILLLCRAIMTGKISFGMMRRVRKNIKKLRKWSHHNAESNQHRLYFLESLYDYHSGKTSASLREMENAILLARKSGFVSDEAMMRKTLGNIYYQQGMLEAGHLMIEKSWVLFRKWGATGVNRFLEKKWKDDIHFRSENEEDDNYGSLQLLDLESLMNASRTIAGSVHTRELIDSLVNILVINAGATSGYLFIRKGQELILEGYAGEVSGSVEKAFRAEEHGNSLENHSSADGITTRTLSPVVTGNYGELLIEHVFATGTTIVLNDARRDSPPILTNTSVHKSNMYRYDLQGSAIVIPVSHARRNIGVVFLQNKLATGVFTPSRVEFLQVLISQAVVHMENTRIYESLERRVNERTEELNRALKDVQHAQEKLVQVEKEATERQMAGGFAHEMRNALSGSQILLDQLLGRSGQKDDLPVTLKTKRSLTNIHNYLSNTLSEEEYAEVFKNMRSIFENEEKVEEAINVLEKSVTRGIAITHQVLEFSRIGKEQALTAPVNIASLIQTIILDLKDSMGTKDIEFRLNTPETLRVVGLENHFHSILSNLINNAIDAVSDSKMEKFSVEKSLIEIGVLRHEDEVMISVKDNGIGILQENQSRIFDTFYSTKLDQGTGLGLGIVKKIIELYNGRIQLHSEPRKGSEFQVFLPLYDV